MQSLCKDGFAFGKIACNVDEVVKPSFMTFDKLVNAVVKSSFIQL